MGRWIQIGVLDSFDRSSFKISIVEGGRIRFEFAGENCQCDIAS